LKRPNGVLLGTHLSPNDSNFRATEHAERTWWIAEIGGEIQVSDIRNLLVPRKDGFWMLGTKMIKKNEEDQYDICIWSAPIRKTPRGYEPDSSTAGCRDETTTPDILFVERDLVAVAASWSSFGGHYDEGTNYYVLTLERPNPSENPDGNTLEISQVLGPAGLQAFSKVLDSIHESEKDDTGEPKSEDIHCGTMGARPSAWAIRRQKGRWVVKGKGSFGDHVCDGYYETEFDVKLRPPKTAVGYDELPLGWGKIEKVSPGAKDTFEAPNRDFLIVLTERELVVSRLTNGEIGTLVSRHPLRENEHAVMSQWALGDNVARWDQQVRQFSDPGAK
jgi:hypothetical protein